MFYIAIMYARYIMAAILKFKMADKPTNTRLNSYCADGAYLHHENIVSNKMS